ncbi:sensor domain-containing diguanylate cyclase [Gallaecimonas mangrovi]|uniref:sensor domain-containing diguanylate cyclase n=1 Tax=Gallaecimonas mangrovi TaxID=2291597 RepID=UPI0012603270|nr:sensor domain-containing diguanylate cyclase [Gallaecimonas mangrovi]
MSWSSYHVAQHAINRQIEENSLPLTSDNVYSQIQRDLVEPTFVATLMAHDTFVRDWALESSPKPAPMQRYLAEIDKRFNTTLSFFALDKNRRLYLPDNAEHIIDNNSPKNAWYNQVKTLPENKPYQVKVGTDPEHPGKMDIYIDHKVFDYQHQFIGVTGVGLSVTRVKKLIEDYQQRYQRTIYFVDRNGKVILHGQHFRGAESLQSIPGMRSISTQILSAPSGSYRFSRNGENIYINARLVPEFNWYLIVEQQASPSQRAVFKSFLTNVFIALAITLVVLTVSLLTQGRYQRKLAAQASVDPLTLALNRLSGKELYGLMQEECQRQAQPMSILLIDIDFFKNINDQYGHDAGDTVLKGLVNKLKTYIRDSDAICRWGGEEFLVLLSGCDKDQAYTLAERIRTGLQTQSFLVGSQPLAITVSGGTTQVKAKESLEQAVARADQALYTAKKNGRNQIIITE